MSEISSSDVLNFWFLETESKYWFIEDADFDSELTKRFGGLLIRAKRGELDHWCKSSSARLALIIILDQFSRNIYRESASAFDTDAKALQLVLDGIEQGQDMQLSPEQRSFFYLPLRHAEDLEMQELGLRKTREVNAAGYGTDKYALSHFALIKRFGRFPHRNAVLNRKNSVDEERYLKGDKADK